MRKGKASEGHKSTDFFTGSLEGRFEDEIAFEWTDPSAIKEEFHASYPQDKPPDSAAIEKSWVDDWCAQINCLTELLSDPRAKHIQDATLSQVCKSTLTLIVSRIKKKILWNNN